MPMTPEFFTFLVENRLHDSKAWFEAHREDYNRLVLEPLRQLVGEMAPVMLAIDPRLVVQPAVGKTISRIFRDTRFSRDKSAFREHMWISFNRESRSGTSRCRSSTSTWGRRATPTAAAGTPLAPG